MAVAMLTKRRVQNALSRVNSVILDTMESDLFRDDYFDITPLYAIAQATHGSISLKKMMTKEGHELYNSLMKVHCFDWDKMSAKQVKHIKQSFQMLVDMVKSAEISEDE